MQKWDFSRREDYERLTKYISNVLRRFRISESVEDFAQEYVLGVLQGKHRYQTIEQFVIDILRQRSGRKGTISYDVRKNISNASELGIFEDTDNGISSDNLDSRIHNNRMREYIKSREYELYSEGYTMKEIGDLYGITE